MVKGFLGQVSVTSIHDPISWQGGILRLGRPTYEAHAVGAYPIISQDPLGSLPGLLAPNAEQHVVP